MEDFYENYTVGYTEDNPFVFENMIEIEPGILKSGTKEDYDNHNKKVAYDYLLALENEEFTKLHNFSLQIINRILISIASDEKYAYYQKCLMDGTLITNKGRSLLDAILEKKATDLAIIYVLASVHDFRLHALCIMYRKVDYNEEESLFSSVIYNCKTKSEYTEYFQNILANIEKFYRKIKSEEEKKEILNNVADAIRHAHCPTNFGKIELNISDFQYGKELKKILIIKK